MEIAFIPRWFVNRFYLDFELQNQLNIFLSNIVIILLFGLFQNSLITYLNYLPHFCLFDKLVGVECPVCGTTRAFCEIASGNFNQALDLNYSSFFVASFFVLQIPLRAISLINYDLIFRIDTISKNFGYLIYIIIFLNWILRLLSS